MWDLFKAGGPVMWPLLLCSIASLTVILERTVFWFRTRVVGETGLIEDLLENCRLGRDYTSPGAGPPSVALKMLLSGLAHRHFSATKAMETVALEELKKMRRYMNILDTVITAAPMLGILGTVLGIITSFDLLGQSGVEDPKAVVGGIAEALITTAAGLIISLATVFPYNYFNSRIEDTEEVLENYGVRLEILCSAPDLELKKAA